MAYNIFISYKNDYSLLEAEKIQVRLEEYGYSAFRDKGIKGNGDNGIKNGQKWITQLNEAINEAQIIIIFITEESLKGFHNDSWKNGNIFENKNSSDYFDYKPQGDVYCQEIAYAIKRHQEEGENGPSIIPLFLRDDYNKIDLDTFNLPESKRIIRYLKEELHHSENILYDHLNISSTFNEKFIHCIIKNINDKGIYPLGEKGKDIKAQDFFYDKKRATIEQGYNDTIYVEREIDNELSHFKDSEQKFLFVTGKPGSGKTRAIYHHIRNTFKEKIVIVINKENIINLYEKLCQFKLNKLTDDIYIVCDQTREVFNKLQLKDRNFLLNKIKSNKHLKFIGSDTTTEYSEFIDEVDIEEEEYSNYKIKDLSVEEKAELALKYKHTPLHAEIVADYIPQLTEHKKNIIEKILNKYNRNYIQILLRAIQITYIYLGQKSMKPIIDIINLYTQDSNKILKALNLLIQDDIRLLSLSKNGQELAEVNMYHHLFKHPDKFEFQIYDDMVWEMLQTNEYSILYKITTPQDTESIFEILPDITTIESLPRLLRKIPQHIEQEDQENADFRWKCIKGLVSQIIGIEKVCTNESDKRLVICALTERSTNLSQITDAFGWLQEIDALAIKSLYKIAKNHRLKINNNRDFNGFNDFLKEKEATYLKKIQKPDNIYNLQIHDLSRIYYMLASHYEELNFEKAISYCYKVHDNIKWDDLKIRKQMGRLIAQLILRCEKPENIKTVWEICPLPINDTIKNDSKLKEEYISYFANLIYSQTKFKSFENSIEIYNYLFNQLDKEHIHRLLSLCLMNCQKNEYQSTVTYIENLKIKDETFPKIAYNILLQKAPNLDDAYYVLSLMKEDADDYSLSNLLENVEHTEKIPVGHILSELPIISYEDRECIKNWLNEKKINKVVDLEYCQKEIAKKDNRTPWEEILLECINRIERRNFFNVYELLNHPRLKGIIHPEMGNRHVINILYSLTQNKDQEIYIHRFFNKNCKDSNDIPTICCDPYILPTLIKKRYRSIEDSIKLYNKHRGTINQMNRPDVYNAMYSKCKSNNYKYQDLIDDINKALRENRIKEDTFLFCNNINENNRIFNDKDNKLTPQFKTLLENENFLQKSIHERCKRLAILLHYIQNTENNNKIWEKSVNIYKYFRDNYYTTMNEDVATQFWRIHLSEKTERCKNYISKEQRKTKRTTTSNQIITDLQYIKGEKDIQKIINKLNNYCDQKGYVSPTIINASLEQISNLEKQSDKTSRDQIFSNILEILNKRLDTMTARGYALLAILTPREEKQQNKTKTDWLEKYDKKTQNGNEINEKALSLLSMINRGEVSLSRTRKYFNRWIQIFKDLYNNPETIAHNLSQKNLNTIGRRLKMEFELMNIQHGPHNCDIDVIQTIRDILEIYSYCDTITFKEDNFINKKPLEEIMERIIHISGEDKRSEWITRFNNIIRKQEQTNEYLKNRKHKNEKIHSTSH